MRALSTEASTQALEVIVVDDGSTDGTGSLAEAAGVRVIRQDNTGPAGARNRGAREATGELLIFTDSDCQPLPGCIERLAAPIVDGRADAAKGAYLTDQRGLGPRFAQAEFENRYRKLSRQDTIDFVDSYAMAIRRDLFLELDGFDESFPVANNEDTEFSYRLSTAGHRIVFVPEARLLHRHRPTLWSYLVLKAGRGYWRMVVYRRFPRKAISDSYTPQMLKLQILLAPTLLGLSLALTCWPLAGWGLMGALALFGLSCMPLVRTNFRRDWLVALLCPLLCFLRALAFCWGICWWCLTPEKETP